MKIFRIGCLRQFSGYLVKWSTFGPGKRPCPQRDGEGSEGRGLLGKTLKLDDCKALCIATSSCTAFAWKSLDNDCYLKHKKSLCDDKPCQWLHQWGGDNEWNWYWMANNCSGAL